MNNSINFTCLLDVSNSGPNSLPPCCAALEAWLYRNGIEHSVPALLKDEKATERHFIIKIDLSKDLKK